MDQSAQTVYRESFESISFFIAYIGLHNSDYNFNKCVKMLQRLPHNLTVQIRYVLDRHSNGTLSDDDTIF